MANRRLGGMGNMRGNRSFSQPQPFQGGNVNPWQRNSGGGSVNEGLLSQISANPQQLALALTSLLQPQQQMNNPPSLLSLNTSPAFSNQDFLSRFGSRGRDNFRRHEPYNKNRPGKWGGANRKGGNNNRRDGKKDVKGKDGKDTKDSKNEKKSEDKNDTDTANDEGKDAEDKTENKDGKDKKYAGIPQGLLQCFVCNKNMWDGESFDKHVRGRAHKQMLQSLDESFHITVNILRESMRLTEEKKLIELNRMARLSKKQRKYEPESSCNMCDLKFLGKIISHRKTDGHQRLKRFLHPNCEICTKEFSARMDWVEHRLTEEHLRKLADHLEKKRDPEDGNEIIENEEIDLEPLLEETMLCEDENPIVELSEDLKDLQNRIPAYKKNRAVSTESLKQFSGFVCELCNRSFTSEDLAQDHLKTHRHYHAFVEAAKNKYKKQMDDAAAEKAAKEKADKEGKEKGEENGEDMYDPEEACKEGDQTMDSQDEDAAAKEEEELLNEDEKEELNEDEKEEAEEEDDDVTMVEDEPEPPKPAAPAVSPRGRRAAAAAAPATPATNSSGGAVKNGAGPKSKKARK